MKPLFTLGFAATLWLGSTLAIAAESTSASTEPSTEVSEPEHYLSAEELQRTTEYKSKDGQVVRRWMADSLTAASYLKLIVEPVVYHPQATPTEQASQETLDEIAAQLTAKEREKLGVKLQLVESAGPGVLRLSTAITGVTIKTEGMKAYEVLPIAAVFGAAKAASGKRKQDVRLFIETRIADSQTGEVLGVSSREVKGQDLKGKKDKLRVEDVEPAFEKALDLALETLSERGF